MCCNSRPVFNGHPDGGTFGIGSFRTPLDFVFYFSIVNSVFAVLGFAGVINGQRELVTGFFVYNAVQMVRCPPQVNCAVPASPTRCSYVRAFPARMQYVVMFCCRRLSPLPTSWVRKHGILRTLALLSSASCCAAGREL